MPTARAFNDGKRHDLSANGVSFMTRGRTLYPIVMGWSERRAVVAPPSANSSHNVGKIENVELLGFRGKLQWKQDENGLTVRLPDRAPSDYAVAFKITGPAHG